MECLIQDISAGFLLFRQISGRHKAKVGHKAKGALAGSVSVFWCDARSCEVRAHYSELFSCAERARGEFHQRGAGKKKAWASLLSRRASINQPVRLTSF